MIITVWFVLLQSDKDSSSISIYNLPSETLPPLVVSRLLGNSCNVADATLDVEELNLISQLNAYRVANGVSTLNTSLILTHIAHWMGNDLAINAYFSHTDSLGRSGYQRSIDCGYPLGAGENLAAGTAWNTSAVVMQAWKNSPGHNQNMLQPIYNWIGVARVFKADSPYGYYWVTEFGTVEDPVPIIPRPIGQFTTVNGTTAHLWIGGTKDINVLPIGISAVFTWVNESQSFSFWFRGFPLQFNKIQVLNNADFYFFQAPAGVLVEMFE